jgi:imidazolonepropionase-like amidohydrolase
MCACASGSGCLSLSSHSSVIFKLFCTIASLVNAILMLCQTNVTYLALRESGLAAGMPPELVAKVGELVEQGVAAVALARKHGIRVVYGSDLLGDLRERQLEGFGLLLDAGMSTSEALGCATSVAAELMSLPAGCIRDGLFADLLLLSCNPLEPSAMRALSPTDVLNVWVGGKSIHQ